MKNITRRSFLKHTALTATALGLSARSWSQVAGANSDVRLAVIGFYGRGQDHIKGFNGTKGVRITAFCDVDKNVLDKEVAKSKAKGQAPRKLSHIPPWQPAIPTPPRTADVRALDCSPEIWPIVHTGTIRSSAVKSF